MQVGSLFKNHLRVCSGVLRKERAWVISEQTSPRFLKDFDSGLGSSGLLITIIGLLCFFTLPGIKCILNS